MYVVEDMSQNNDILENTHSLIRIRIVLILSADVSGNVVFVRTRLIGMNRIPILHGVSPNDIRAGVMSGSRAHRR